MWIHRWSANLKVIRLMLFFGILGSTFALGAESESPKKASRYVLENGLTVVVKEDHRAPVFMSQIWYKVGSVDEPVGNTGVAHVLEHMMFKGTQHLDSGAYSKLIAEFGGHDNATTNSDYTFYYAKMGASRLPLFFALEADRMTNLTFSAEEFDREIRVVQEERRLRIEDLPIRLFAERYFAIRYDSSGYHHPVAGWMADLKRLTVRDVKAFYERWYRPENAVVVVVGDVDTDQVFLEAEKTFGHIVKGNFRPAPNDVVELASIGKKEFVAKLPTQIPVLYMGFSVPSIVSAESKEDVFALTILSQILSGGSGRLKTELVRNEEVATVASVNFSPFQRGDGNFLFTAIPNIIRDKTLADVRSSLEKQIARIKASPPTSEEVAQVRAQIVAQQTYSEDEMSNQARWLGLIESLGLGIEFHDDYFDKLKKITAEDVQRVAQKYLIDDHLVYGELIPNNSDDAFGRDFK